MNEKIMVSGKATYGDNCVGSWCFSKISENGDYVSSYGFDKTATSYRMFLTAILNAIINEEKSSEIEIFCIDKACVNAINLWMKKWVKNNDTEKKSFDLIVKIHNELKVKKKIKIIFALKEKLSISESVADHYAEYALRKLAEGINVRGRIIRHLIVEDKFLHTSP